MNRVAVVTGAARGIGAATVGKLVGQGCRVIAIDSCGQGAASGAAYPMATRSELDAVAETHAGMVDAVELDVRDAAALADAVADARVRYGRIDVAVAAAGIVGGGVPVWETPATLLEDLWQVNSLGVWNVAAAVVPAMLAGPDPAGCRFVAVASAAGEHGLFSLGAYAVSKHAVIGIVRALAADLVGTGVTAVAVSPGSTDTAMLRATANVYDLEEADELAAHQLLRRVITPDEVAETIAFCSSAGGGVLNGSVVRAGGGFGA